MPFANSNAPWTADALRFAGFMIELTNRFMFSLLEVGESVGAILTSLVRDLSGKKALCGFILRKSLIVNGASDRT